MENSTHDTAPPTSHQTPPHNTGPSPSPFSLSPTFGRAAPYPWFLGVSHPGQWWPGVRPAYCLSDHASSPTPFSLSPALCPAAPQRTLGLGTAAFSQCWLRIRPRPRSSRPRPPLVLQAPPHPRTPGTRPHHSVGKLPGGLGGKKAPIPPIPLGSALAPSTP